VPAAASGTPSTRAGCAQRACTRGRKPSAVLVADGRRTQNGTRNEIEAGGDEAGDSAVHHDSRINGVSQMPRGHEAANSPNGNSENRALIYRSGAALSTLVTKSTRNFISRRLGAAAYEDQKTKGREQTPITLGFVDLDLAEAAVLASLRSPGSRRCYEHAITEFIGWFCSEPRFGFNRLVVTRYRIHLETRRLAPGTINLRLAAIRRLACEAADSGLLSPELQNSLEIEWGTREVRRSRQTLPVQWHPRNVIRWRPRSTFPRSDSLGSPIQLGEEVNGRYYDT